MGVDSTTKKWLSDQVIQQKKRKAKRLMSLKPTTTAPNDVESGMLSADDAAVPSLYSAVVPLSAEKQVALHENLKGCVEWNYDAKSCFDLADGNGVVFLTRYLMHSVLDLQAKLPINGGRLDRFLLKIQDGSLPNPYHNNLHSADVVQATYFILSRPEIKPLISHLAGPKPSRRSSSCRATRRKRWESLSPHSWTA